MKILDAGDHPLSNADVLDWIASKRAQHTREDAEEAPSKPTKGKDSSKNKSKQQQKPDPRPKNFLTALARTERELSSPKYYPYSKNPTTYAGSANRAEKFQVFALEVEDAMMESLEREWMSKDEENGGGEERKKKWDEGEFAKAQEMKCLSEMELLMVFNLAPTCVEMLQPMLENVEERFSAEEQGVLVDVIWRCLRVDEKRPE